MKEQRVRYSEQNSDRESGTTLPVVPAPMVERAFRLLDLLSVSEDGLTLSDMARALRMSKGSIHGLLKTLENSSVIELSEERRYTLGPRIYDLAQSYVQRAGLRHFAVPAMHRLAENIEETILLGRVELDSVRIIECVQEEGENPSFQVSARRGTRVPLLAGAIGRLVLADWPMGQRAEYLSKQPLPHYTERSITNVMQYMEAVAESAHTGISIEHEEYLVGVNAVATPIYGPGRTLVALLWIVGFSSHFGDEAIERAARLLRMEAEEISRSLGAK